MGQKHRRKNIQGQRYRDIRTNTESKKEADLAQIEEFRVIGLRPPWRQDKPWPLLGLWGCTEPKRDHIPGSGVQCQQILGIMWPGAQRVLPAHWGERSKDHLLQPGVELVAPVKCPGCQDELSLLQLEAGLMWMLLASTFDGSQARGLGWAWEERPHPGPSSDSSLQEQAAHSVASRWPSPQSGT